VSGQGVLGRPCAWCGLPATGEVEVQAARYRTVSRRDPVTGKRTAHQQFERAAVVVPIRDTHRQITRSQPPPVSVPRTAQSVQQLDMFVTLSGGEAR
jgi:hypothetical protein